MPDLPDQYALEQLSPISVAPRLVDLPYELSWDDLRPCLPGYTDRVRAEESYAKQGLHGGDSSRILTLHYRHQDGSERSPTVFVKESTEAPAAEAAKYRFLAAREIPTPELLQMFSRGGREILVLEFLTTIGIEPDDADELLALISRLNSVKSPPVDTFRPRAGLPVPEFHARVHAALEALAMDPAVQIGVDPGSWLSSYQGAGRAVVAMPGCLNHGELYFQQVGWSTAGGGRRLVMFDLETMALLPRFTDVAGILHGLSHRTGRDERELFSSYLQYLNQLTGAALDEVEAWHELLLVRVVRTFQSLPWLIQDGGQQKQFEAISGLNRDLGILGLLR